MNGETRQTPAQLREAEEIMRVALAQPHRRAWEGRWQASRPSGVGTPLFDLAGRLRLREELYEAGVQYSHVSRRGKIALDVPVPGLADEPGGGESEEDREKRARRDKVAFRDAIYVLRRISRQCFFALEDLCFYERNPGECYDGLAKRGLSAMALHFGLLPVDVYAPG